MAKGGLGRGLNALMPENYGEAAEDEKSDSGVRSIPLGRISPSPDQPRKSFDESSIDELANSIRRHGIIQPLIVEAVGDGSFRIVAGERRWRAAGRAGLKEAPVLVRELGRERRLEVALVENIQREDLNPIDEAEAYRQLMEVTNLTQEEVAERVGKSRSAVANVLRLLNLPVDAMEALRNKQLSAGHARAVLAVINPAERTLLLKRILGDGISVREAEAAVALFNKGQRAVVPEQKAAAKNHRPTAGMDPDLAMIEQNLIGHLGTKVSIKGDSERGSIQIDFFSMDDLNRVYALITGENLN
ncbi:MAG: ParB/RepB/Spo0J family partition protein [Spirochaetes bacterium]|nr:ParB/RepB/Spo0J family partition protein [Spirochaetota bacterium]MBU0956958.1 ParB/RepB/Spo0J family partition protein [Spirochaetota bacterium]